MKDWANIAKAQGLSLPARDLDRLVQTLGALEQSLQPLTLELRPDLEPASEFHMEDE